MTQAVADKPRYAMPIPRIGQDVDWFPGGDKRQPQRAVVRKIYQEKIELLNTVGGAYPVHVCFHCDHPAVLEKTMDFSIDGTWDFTPEEKELKRWKQQIESDLQRLCNRVAELESDGDKPKLRRSKPEE